MPNFLPNIPWLRKLLSRGANTDISPELFPEGTYYDARNMRPRSLDGATGSMEAVKGEELAWAINLPEPNTYIMIGSETTQSRVVEFWASSNPALPKAVVIDGQLAALSDRIPYEWNRTLQIAVSDKCREGVLFPVDRNAPPLFWDIGDMLQNLADNTGKYFADYNPQENSSVLLFDPEWPVHKGNPNVGNGLPTGQYQYYLRARTPAGDLTNPGPATPLITIPAFQDPSPNTNYPGGRTAGGSSNVLVQTPYGIQLQFRIDNVQGFSEYAVCRRRFNNGEGLNGPGIDEIIARIPSFAGEFRIVGGDEPFIDPVNANDLELIPPDQVPDLQVYVDRPGAVEFADNRLTYADFETQSSIPDIDFVEVDGRTVFPFTKKLSSIVGGEEVNDGYANPVHNTYYKSLMRGEKYRFGAGFFNAASGKSFVKDIPGAQNLQMPNRRDVKGANGQWGNDSLLYSDDPLWNATTQIQTDSRVDATFEAMGQGSKQKVSPSNITEPVNVIPVNTSAGQLPYVPLTPRSPSDNADGYNKKPNLGRVLNYGDDNSAQTDTGNIWSPSYHALGLAIYGIQRSTIPSWAKVITIARTQPAGRVIAQGIATYDFDEAGQNPSFYQVANKFTNRWIWWGRDVQSAFVLESTWDDVINNPQNYSLQAVAPLGFYNETYGWWRVGGLTSPNARAFDMLLYAGVQRDNGEVNVGESNVGITPILPNVPQGNYVTFGQYRNAFNPNSYWVEGSNDGNSLISLADNGVQVFDVSQRGRAIRFLMDNNVYLNQSTGDARNFGDAGVRNFHEPFYVVNVVRDAAEVPEQNNQQYIATEYIKVEGCIGITDDSPVQLFPLVNERLDDVRPRFTNQLRYVYVRTPGQPERAWVCVSNTTQVNGNVVLAEIAANGFYTTPDGTQVYGIYQAFTDAFGDQFVRFGQFGLGSPVPPPNSRIIAKYDDRAPILSFGGDVTISPSIHSVLDRACNFGVANSDDSFEIGGLPLPYPGFVKASAYLQPITGSTVDQWPVVTRQQSIRQLAILGDIESRTPGIFTTFDPLAAQAFPNRHYILRPYSFNSSVSASVNGFYPSYDTDYPQEWTQWAFGGMPTQNEYNLDYSKKPLVEFFGIPRNGFEEQLDFCTSLIASLERDPLAQDLPGLRTFLRDNIKAISEENGRIKLIASLLQGGQRNMYALTESGVCMVLTNKNVLTGASGEAVSTQAISNYWGEEVWISRAIGSPDNFWQLAAVGTLPTQGGYADAITFPDRRGWYMLMGGSVVPIARDKYLKKLLPLLKALPTGNMTGIRSKYNSKQEEVWNPIPVPGTVINGQLTRTSPLVMVYNPLLGNWTGEYTYLFDGYSVRDQDVYGHRNLETFLLDQGSTINSVARQAWVEVPFFEPFNVFKWAGRWRVVGTKPDYVELYDENRNLLCRMDETTGGEGWAKLYNGYEGWVHAVLESVNPQRPQAQGMGFFLRIGYTTFGDKRITSAEMQNKQII